MTTLSVNCQRSITEAAERLSRTVRGADEAVELFTAAQSLLFAACEPPDPDWWLQTQCHLVAWEIGDAKELKARIGQAVAYCNAAGQRETQKSAYAALSAALVLLGAVQMAAARLEG